MSSKLLKAYDKPRRQRDLDKIIENLEEEDQEALIQVLNDKTVESTRIGELLRKEFKFGISDKSIQRYRKEILWA